MSDRPVPAEPLCFVCRCEEVTAARLEAEIAFGAATINDLKRRTRAGMGLCQGAYCLNEIAHLLSECTGQTLDAILPMTFRPPARPITLEALAKSSD